MPIVPLAVAALAVAVFVATLRLRPERGPLSHPRSATATSR